MVSEDQGEVIERGIRRDHRGQQKLAPARQGTFSAPGTSSPIIRDHRTPSAPVPSSSAAPSSGGSGTSSVVGGTFEPDYRYPWVVRMNGCGAVLIDPEWVLTAAHCVTANIGFGSLSYSRTDPYTGVGKTETRTPAPVGKMRDGVFMHPGYDPKKDHANDIALIKLAKPFTISSYLQTVGLPKFSRNPGRVGTVASAVSHTSTTPTGQLAIFRGPIAAIDSPTKLFVQASAVGGALCPGDSGSGFVVVEYGRAVVRGVASQGSVGDCKTPTGEAVFTDVFAFRGWILQTMGKSDASLTGNTRIRWSGRMARGKMVVACFNPYGNLEGPLNVIGVEEGAMCEPGQTQTVMCNLDKNQSGTVSTRPILTGLTMRTTKTGGASQVQTLRASANTASFFGLLPAGTTREFTCQIGTATTTGGIGGEGGVGAVLSRGIEEGQPTEPIIEQPSPFDPVEGSIP